MKQVITTYYTLAELKEQFPAGYARAWENWQQAVAEDECPWSGEIMDSLKALFAAAGVTMQDWQLGAYSRGNRIDVGEFDAEDATGEEALAWAMSWIPEGTLDAAGKVVGRCGFTGYCADDDLIESVLDDIRGGCTCREALRNLADVVGSLMEQEIEQMQDEESFQANCEHRHYTEHGEKE